jgi:ABC-type phosphate/phosphonate transport system substrate-binding protein
MTGSNAPGQPAPKFLLDSNLGLPVGEKPWSAILPAAGIAVEPTTNLEYVNRVLADHKADIAYIPTADFYHVGGKGDHHYRGLAIATSKFTGQPTQRSLLLVRRDDPATDLKDLRKARYGYINKSCSSSYFPPAILLNKQGIKLSDFFSIEPVKPWQGQIEAVLGGTVRATMVLEDVWKSTPRNQEETKIIGHFDGCKPPVVVVSEGLDESIRRKLLDALIFWIPSWEGVYGAFRPYYYADVQSFFHELDQLPDHL